MKAGLTCALLVLAWPAIAQVTAAGPTSNATVPAVPADSLDTPGQSAAKKLPRDLLDAKPQRFSEADKARVDVVTRLDEILIYGQIEPEDRVGPDKSPIIKFRERLDKDRPMTPREKAQLALCLIGLCANYGPDGLPREPSRMERRESRIEQSTIQLNSQFNGTLQ